MRVLVAQSSCEKLAKRRCLLSFFLVFDDEQLLNPQPSAVFFYTTFQSRVNVTLWLVHACVLLGSISRNRQTTYGMTDAPVGSIFWRLKPHGRPQE